MTSSAGLIAVTRTRDYWHNYDDVLAGSLIGLGIAVFIYSVHYYDVILTLKKEHDMDKLHLSTNEI